MDRDEQREIRQAAGKADSLRPRLARRKAGSSRKGDAADNGDSATAPTETEEIVLSAAKFEVLRSAYYHSARHKRYSALHRWLMFLVVLAGTAGFANIATSWVGQAGFGFITASLATLDLVLDLRGNAELHGRLRSQFLGLLARIERSATKAGSDAPNWRAEMIELTAQSADEYRCVDAIAHNEALDTLGLDPNFKLVIPWWHKRLAHVSTFRGYEYLYVVPAPR